ncbi:hypothetical protein J4218_06785 [Candidatus Pacearchaeota archaeon]|nr:hypothetical protein [Candidatus Pacearchaeota archaeon]
MKKTHIKIIITLVAIIALIILVSVYSYNKYKENKEIQEINKVEFKLLSCVSNCSIIHSLNSNASSLSKSCLNNCTAENNISLELQKKKSSKTIDKRL